MLGVLTLSCKKLLNGGWMKYLNRYIRLSAPAVALLFLLIGNVLCVNADSSENKKGGPPPARVVTEPVIERAVAETTKVVGTLFFDTVSHLSTDVSGLVASLNFTEGDTVKKGDRMLLLNTDFIKNEIASVRASIDQVNVRLKKAEKDLRRYATLYRQDAASEKEYDDMALSKEDLVKQKVILKKKLELARLKQHKSIINAPFDGIILEKKTEVGNWVSPGSILCTLASLDHLFVKAPVSENLLMFSRESQEVHVTVSGMAKEMTGIIDGIIPVADPQTKTVFVKIKLPRLQNAILNMSATVSLPRGEKRNMLLVPRDALINVKGQDMVYIVTDGKASPVTVRILSFIENHAAIEGNGLHTGMSVVVDGNDRLRPGQPVTIIE